MQVKAPNRYRTEKPGSVSPHEISPSYGDQRTLDRVCRHALAHRRECGSHLLREELGLFPSGEVSAPIDLVEVGEVGVAPFGPAARGTPDLVGEGGEADRNRDLRRSLAGRLGCGHELSELPVPSGGRGAGARQPVQRDVVDDVLAREVAYGLPVDEGAGDLVVAVGVVVEQPGGQGDG